jgi:hypothetical protein
LRNKCNQRVVKNSNKNLKTLNKEIEEDTKGAKTFNAHVLGESILFKWPYY